MLEEIVQPYRKGMQVYRERTYRGEVNETEIENIKYLEIVKKIHAKLEIMNKDYAIIIVNDYLKPQDKNWWKDKYNRSTYYRYKRLALDHFFSKEIESNEKNNCKIKKDSRIR